MWHVTLSGIPPVHPSVAAALPSWQPWPGESVRIQVTRPEGIGGATLTLDQATMVVRPGVRSTETTLQATLRTTRGDQHAFRLPAGAEVMGVTVNGAPQPGRLEGGRLLFSLAPPLTRVEVTWREQRGISSFFRPSGVDVGAAGVNAYVSVQLPADRWILWLGGPAFGPVVLFWGALVVTLLVALGLSRVPNSPLRVGAWVLLSIGLTQVPVVAGAVVVAWLLALAWRGAYGARVAHFGLFDLMQLGLLVLTIAALGVLFQAVKQGLLGQPDMQITGNSSTATLLRWAEDRVSGPLPTPLVVSVPLLVYRLAMLAWALWLAASLLRWFRWGWQAFGTGGLWRPPPPQACSVVVTATVPRGTVPPAGASRLRSEDQSQGEEDGRGQGGKRADGVPARPLHQVAGPQRSRLRGLRSDGLQRIVAGDVEAHRHPEGPDEVGQGPGEPEGGAGRVPAEDGEGRHRHACQRGADEHRQEGAVEHHPLIDCIAAMPWAAGSFCSAPSQRRRRRRTPRR